MDLSNHPAMPRLAAVREALHRTRGDFHFVGTLPSIDRSVQEPRH